MILIIIGLFAGLYVGSFYKATCPPKPLPGVQKQNKESSISETFGLLKIRKDNEALAIFEKILSEQPDNLNALWGKAEVLRRMRKYKESESILKKEVLKNNPNHASSLISLSYIRYKDDRLNEALELVNQVLKTDSLDRENKALAYMMLGTINSRRSAKGWFFSKIKYGTQIRRYFLKAKELAPDLPEVHLGLGTFYLLAPAIIGGDLNRAIEELEYAVGIASDFATANARLAQAYKKKSDLEKYNFYIQRAKKLDPENEVLKELQEY